MCIPSLSLYPIIYSKPGMPKVRPGGQIRPATKFCLARGLIQIYEANPARGTLLRKERKKRSRKTKLILFYFTAVLNYLVFYYYNIYLILQKIFLIINISISKLIILIDCKSLFTKEQKQGPFQ